MKTQLFELGRPAVYSETSLDVLAIFREEADKPKKIEPGMSSEELSDVISDRLIELVKKDLRLASEDLTSQVESAPEA